MRTLTIINDFSDIYQPVLQKDIEFAEKELNCSLPQGLKDIYLNPNPEHIKSLPTLLWPVHHHTIGIIEVNLQLQVKDYDPFPANLIAFATNECGDFWVIDTRDLSVIYIDPDKEVKENLASEELHFPDFMEWLKRKR